MAHDDEDWSQAMKRGSLRDRYLVFRVPVVLWSATRVWSEWLIARLLPPRVGRAYFRRVLRRRLDGVDRSAIAWRSRMLINLSMVEERALDWAASEQAIREAMSLVPHNYYSLAVLLASTLKKSGRVDEARNLCADIASRSDVPAPFKEELLRFAQQR
jgi:hypothetical protein